MAKAKRSTGGKASLSKMEQARRIFGRTKDKSRGNIVPKFEKTLGMSKAMAGTYYQSIKSAA